MNQDAHNHENHWPELWEFICLRCRKPLGHPSYIFYFLIILMGVGGIGVWKAIFFDKAVGALASNLLTYFPAVAAASAFEIVLNKNLPKYAQTGTMVIGALLLIAIVYIWINDLNPSCSFVGILSSFVALFLWWIANSENSVLLDTPQKTASIGGDVMQKVQGEMGDLKS